MIPRLEFMPEALSQLTYAELYETVPYRTERGIAICDIELTPHGSLAIENGVQGDFCVLV